MQTLKEIKVGTILTFDARALYSQEDGCPDATWEDGDVRHNVTYTKDDNGSEYFDYGGGVIMDGEEVEIVAINNEDFTIVALNDEAQRETVFPLADLGDYVY